MRRNLQRAVVLGSARSLLREALGYWSADLYDAASDSLVEQRLKGLGNARLGSAVGADTNDPQRVIYSGEKYLLLPGTAGNYASTPSAAANQITGDIDLRVDVAFDSWTPALEAGLIAKEDSAGTRSYSLRLRTDSKLGFSLSADGSVATAANSSAAISGSLRQHIRATWRQSDGRVQFFTSLNGQDWTQLGTDQTIAIASIFNSTSSLTVGQRAGTNFMAGKNYSAEVRNGIDGAVVAKFDAARHTAEGSTATAETGEVWTINRATAAGSKAQIIDRTCLLGNLSDYAIVTSGLPTIGTGDFTIAGVMRVMDANPSVSDIGGPWYLGPTASASHGANSLHCNITTGGLFLVSKRSAANALQTVGSVQIVSSYGGRKTALILSRSAGVWTVSANGVQLFSNSNFGSETVDSTYLGIGSNQGAYSDFPIFNCALFNRALSLADHRRLAIEMGASV